MKKNKYKVYYSNKDNNSKKLIKLINDYNINENFKLINIEKRKKIPSFVKGIPLIVYKNNIDKFREFYIGFNNIMSYLNMIYNFEYLNEYLNENMLDNKDVEYLNEHENDNQSNIIDNMSNLSESAPELKESIENLENITNSFDETSKKINEMMINIEEKDNTLGKLIYEDSLYININGVALDLRALIKDVQENPTKYMKAYFQGKK